MAERGQRDVSKLQVPGASSASCDQEFDDIHHALQRMSKEIDTEMLKSFDRPNLVENKSDSPGTQSTPKDAVSSSSLETLLSCSNEEFDKKTRSMSVTGLEIAIMVFEEQIKSEVSLSVSEDKTAYQDENSKLFQLRDRLTRCFIRKLNLSNTSNNLESDNFASPKAPRKPQRYRFRASASSKEIGSMRPAQLKELLMHNGIVPDENATKEELFSMLRDMLCIGEEEEGEEDDWQPPSENEFHWQEPSFVETQSMTDMKAIKNDDNSPGSKKSTHEIMSTTGEKLSASDRSETNNHGLHPQNYESRHTEEKSAVNWDPTPLLKDLYKNITGEVQPNAQKRKEDTVLSRQQDSNQDLTMSGYLDKLPVNQIKATVFKSWKKRFFKITDSKLHYYHDHKAETPIGHITLTGSEITVPDEKLIQVTSKQKNETIVLRCTSLNECRDWYQALHAAAVNIPKTTKQMHVEVKQKSPTIVIDLGGTTIKGGFAGDEYPTVAFPAVYAVKYDKKSRRKFTESGIPDPSLCKLGFEAFLPETRKVSKLIYPLKPTLKVDKYSVKIKYIPGFIEKVVNSLEIDPQNTTVIVICPHHFSDKDKESVLDFLFGQLGMQAAYIQQQAVLSLFSNNVTSGIVVDIGDHVDVVPVVEGVIVESGTSSLPFGGQQVTEHLSKLLSEYGYRFFSDIESLIVKYVKEKAAFVSLNINNELAARQVQATVETGQFNLPGGQSNINLASARFRCTEGFFNPGSWGKDNQGIHHLVEKAIKSCGIDQKRRMCREIYLSGGTSLLEGFAERLQKELKFLMPESVVVKVHTPENRINSAFLGASVISKLEAFPQMVITNEDWLHSGSELLRRWADS